MNVRLCKCMLEHTLSGSNKCMNTNAKGHHSLLGLTRKRSLCIGRCNFRSHFLCMDSNYWSSARQGKKLILFRYDNHWLIGQHIRRLFGCQGWRDRWGWGGGGVETGHTQNCTQMDAHTNAHAYLQTADMHILLCCNVPLSMLCKLLSKCIKKNLI